MKKKSQGSHSGLGTGELNSYEQDSRSRKSEDTTKNELTWILKDFSPLLVTKKGTDETHNSPEHVKELLEYSMLDDLKAVLLAFLKHCAHSL